MATFQARTAAGQGLLGHSASPGARAGAFAFGFDQLSDLHSASRLHAYLSQMAAAAKLTSRLAPVALHLHTATGD